MAPASNARKVAPIGSFRSSGDLLTDRRFGYAQAALEDGDFGTAADVFAQAIERSPRWPPAWFGLGMAKVGLATSMKAGAGVVALRDEAAAAFRQVLALDPEDRLGAAIELALLGAGSAEQAISPAFVTQLFDDYADRFDAHLTQTLGYAGPELLRSAVEAACHTVGREAWFERVVDLGCGTGLLAQAFQGVGMSFAGVDLSPAMIAQARLKGLYASLTVAPIQAWLEAQSAASADLVIAADVFAYLGDLAPVLRESARILALGGLLCFTVQLAREGPYSLGPDRRTSHARPYVEACVMAAGLVLMSVTEISTRTDRGVRVPGLAVVAEPKMPR